MDREEFFFLIPGILYGVALFDLLSTFRRKRLYWETVLWAAFLFFALVAILFDLYPKLGAISRNYATYVLYLLSPVLFVHACYTLTPSDTDGDMSSHFHDHRQLFFASLTGLLMVNILVQFLVIDDHRLLMRLALVLIFAINIVVDKLYLRLVALGVVLAAIVRVII